MTTHAQQHVRTRLGFWIYVLTDCVLFASLFATFAVLRGASFGGPTQSQLLNLPFVLGETFILLTSSFTMGLALVAAQSGHKKVRPYFYLAVAVTLLLGLAFLGLELREFHNLILEGNGPSRSAFLSSFFALVGTHGLHVAAASLWLVIMLVQSLRGMSPQWLRRFENVALFWHFLDIVWIFIFSLVYLFGAL